MVWGEPAEVGGVTDEDMMLTGQVVFQFGGSFCCHFHQHEIGLRLSRCDTFDLVEQGAETLCLCKISVEVLNGGNIVFQQPFPCFGGQCIDRPRPVVFTKQIDDGAGRDDISDAETGYGMRLGERMELHDVFGCCRLLMWVFLIQL